MRVVAAIMTLVLLGASALAAQALWRELSLPPETALAPPPDAADAPAPPEPVSDMPSRRWPALFGQPEPPAPPSPVIAPEPPVFAAPPRPPKPPLDSLGYTLNGVVQVDDATWAVIMHPTGPRLVRVGDELEPGNMVDRIDDDGLWLSRDGDEAELLAFPE